MNFIKHDLGMIDGSSLSRFCFKMLIVDCICLVSWFSKKQVSVALSTAEAEYVAASLCCS